MATEHPLSPAQSDASRISVEGSSLSPERSDSCQASDEDMTDADKVEASPRPSPVNESELVNTAQNALLHVDPSIAGQPAEPSKAQTNGEDVHRERDLKESPAASASASAKAEPKPQPPAKTPNLEAPARVLVSLREGSPDASASAACNGDGSAKGDCSAKDDPVPASPKSTRDVKALDGSSHQAAPNGQPLHASAEHETPSLQADRPNLPSIGHLTELAEAAFHTRNENVRAHRASITSTGGAQNQSSPPPSAGLSNPDPSRPATHHLSNQQRSQNMQGQRHAGSYAVSQTSPASPYHDPSSRDSFRQSRELPTMTPPPGPSHSAPHPYYYNRRPSQASENGPPYAPHPPHEGSYPPPSIVDGNSMSQGFPSGMGAVAPPAAGDPGRPPQPVLQRHQNGHVTAGGFRCNVPGCPAPPFHTQYLLK